MASRPTYKIDATGKVLGRLATEVSCLLRGKNTAAYTQQLDVGHQVVVYNVDKIRVTGRKLENKMYYRHSGYIGNLKSVSLKDMKMSDAFRLAVKGMLPHNRLHDKWLKRLKIYSGAVPTRPSKSQVEDLKKD
jgi:large subunit ribosomal protein L13